MPDHIYDDFCVANEGDPVDYYDERWRTCRELLMTRIEYLSRSDNDPLIFYQKPYDIPSDMNNSFNPLLLEDILWYVNGVTYKLGSRKLSTYTRFGSQLVDCATIECKGKSAEIAKFLNFAIFAHQCDRHAKTLREAVMSHKKNKDTCEQVHVWSIYFDDLVTTDALRIMQYCGPIDAIEPRHLNNKVHNEMYNFIRRTEDEDD